MQLTGSPEHRACPICKGPDSEPLHEQRFLLPQDHPMADHYTVVCCRTCGFVFADTIVDQEKFNAFYTSLSKYEDDETGTGGGGTAWDQERLQQSAAGISRIVDRHAAVLDIGWPMEDCWRN